MKKQKELYWSDVFETVCKRIESKKEMPEIIDYWLAPSYAQQVLFDAKNFKMPMVNLDFGGNEGIYVDYFIDNVRFGCIKTLSANKAAMEIMGKLIGTFNFELSQYAWELERQKEEAL